MKIKDLKYLIRSWIKKGKLTPVHDGYKHKEIEPGELMAGAITKTVRRLDGQWTDFLPEEERQSGRLVETMGCTGYGSNNAIEILVKVVYGLIINLSDRALNKASNTTTSGNNINNVLDTIRKIFGAVAEALWTWDRDTFTWAMYYSSIPKSIWDVGKNWLNNVELLYENVAMTPVMMMDNLKYSPLIVAGYAWYLENGLYRSYGSANHCFVIVGYVQGQYWLAYDSYSPFVKKLAWDYRFGACKVITLNIKEPIKDYSLGVTDSQAEINNLISRGLKFIQRPQSHGEFYRLSSSGLEFIPDIKVIANEIGKSIEETADSGERQKLIDAIIKSMSQNGLLIGISEELFAKLQ